MKRFTIALACGLLIATLAPTEMQAQKRKKPSKGNTKTTLAQPELLPIYTTTESHIDTTWMLPGGVAFELGIDLQLPACNDCPTYHTVREWYKTHYARLSNETQYAEAQLARFALDAAPQQSAADSTTTTKKKKRKSRKERRAEAERLAAMTVTNKTPRYSLDLDLECLFENNYITTYRLSELHYTPHGRGQEQQYYITVNKATGKPLQWDELYQPKQKRKFVMALANSLQRHFNASDWKNLTHLLKTPTLKPNALPLPVATPVIIEGSLYAVYTTGEITSATSEAPTLIVDAQWLKGLLTPAAIYYFK